MANALALPSRLWRHHRLVALSVALTLAVGIGVTTFVGALLDAVLLRPLPLPQEAGVAVIWGINQSTGEDHVGLPYGLAKELEARNPAVLRAGTVMALGSAPFAARDGERLLSVRGVQVSGGFFPTLEVRPVLGRMLGAQDAFPGAPNAIVISYGMWQQAFGADSQVIGHQLTFLGVQQTIVGVAAPEFDFPENTEIWAPVRSADAALPEGLSPGYEDILVRLRPGVTLHAAQKDLEAIARDYQAHLQGDPQSLGIQVHSLREVIVGRVSQPLVILGLASLLVLVIACINVAGILLTHGLGRSAEFSLRAALGATNWRLGRDLLAEHVVLGILGGVLALGIASIGILAGPALLPAGLPRAAALRLDARLFTVGAFTTVCAVLLSGIAPAWLVARHNIAHGLRSRSDGGGGFLANLRQATVALQIALGLVVLAMTGALAKSLANQNRVPLGFERHDLVFVGLEQLEGQPVDEVSWARALATYRRTLNDLISEVPRLPGVQGASAVTALPFAAGVNTSYAIQTQTFDDASATQTVALERATPTYFDVMGISLIRGRVFDSSDRTGAEPVVIVGATFARQVWGTADPIGQRLRLEAADEPFRTVVGIVGDTRYRTIDAPMPAVYVPLDQSPDAAPAYLTIRTLPSSNGNVADEIKTLLLAKSPKYGIREIVPVTTLLDRPLAQSRLLAGVFAILSATVLVLVAMGVFGVLGEFVRQRRRDLGVRAALGATPSQLCTLVLQRATALTLIGISVGISAAIAATRLARSQLFEVSAVDLPVLAAVGIVSLLTSLGAAWLPARSAARGDPLESLKSE